MKNDRQTYIQMHLVTQIERLFYCSLGHESVDIIFHQHSALCQNNEQRASEEAKAVAKKLAEMHSLTRLGTQKLPNLARYCLFRDTQAKNAPFMTAWFSMQIPCYNPEKMSHS